MVNIKNGYPKKEINSSGTQISTVYYSTVESEIDAKLLELKGEGFSRLMKTTENGIYELECVQILNTDGEYSNEPDRSYGALSQTLSGSLLSMPLEQHPNYRTKWNHYLFGKTSTVPSFWNTAVNTQLTSSDYVWGDKLADRPDKTWQVVKDPTMPGVQHYTIPTYVLTETARYRSFQEAARALGDRVGKRVSPATRIPVSGNRDWLCEDGRIAWDGKFWTASYTYTLSGPGGWNSELYN